MIGVERVGQAIDDHGVDQRNVAHLGPGTQLLRMRGERHALLPARDHDPGIARCDRLRCQRHGAQAGAADLVDGEGGTFHRNTGADRCLAGGVLTEAGGQDMAQDHLVHFVRADSGLLQRRDDGGLAQHMRRGRAQGTHKAAYGGALGGGDDNIGQGPAPVRKGRVFSQAHIASASLAGKPCGKRACE